MSRKAFLLSLVAALFVSFLLGFTLGGLLIKGRSEQTASAPQKKGVTADDARTAREESSRSEPVAEPAEKHSRSAPQVERRTLLAGTDWQTDLVIVKGYPPEPKMLVLGGVHGDEPAAYWSGNAASELRVSKGTLYVIPHFNEVARRKGTREGAGDINRKFPGNPAGDPEDQLCYQVTSLIREEGIKLVMTFHEALGFLSESSHPGQSLYYDWHIHPVTGKDLTAKARLIIGRINQKIMANPRGYQPRELFDIFVDPIATSATYEMMTKMGVDYAYGCEVCKFNDKAKRVWFHLTALTTWMEEEGFVIDNWPEVEARIWEGRYSLY